MNTSPGWPREVTESVVAEGRRVTHVAVKVRTATFFTRTKISKLPEPTTDPDEVAHGPGRARPLRARPTGPPARRPRRARGGLGAAAALAPQCGAVPSEHRLFERSE